MDSSTKMAPGYCNNNTSGKQTKTTEMTAATTTATTTTMASCNRGKRKSTPAASLAPSRKELSSFALFLSVVIFLNLCPFQPELEQPASRSGLARSGPARSLNQYHEYVATQRDLGYLDGALSFIKLMFKNPIDLSANERRPTRFMQADAKIIAKMAKMWYIKKKIKKFNKKLKKHTIAVPVITAIPIYEHSYYPAPHVTHVGHPGMHHAAAASYYSPAYVPAPASSGGSIASSASAAASGQLATSASNTHQQLVGFRVQAPHHHMAHPHHHQASGSMYHHPQHQIINSYAPSPPMYVDDNGGLYGAYGNAYGRYDGGYHIWKR